MGATSSLGRVAAVIGLLAVFAALVWVFFLSGATSYTVKAYFLNAGQLVDGSEVQIAGTKVGTVTDLEITPNGQAKVYMELSGEGYTPLPRGTKAVIRQASLSGIANRYVSLQLPEGVIAEKIPDGGEITIDSTVTQVELDEVFNTLDPVARVAVQEFFKGQARQFKGKGEIANEGFRYLSPSLSTSSELFRELNRDTPTLVRFLEDSANLTTILATRTDELTQLITRFNVTTRALGNRRLELIEVLERFPDFMRLANSTFVNLRGTLDEVDPLVEASKPVARRLPGFFDELRPFARDARPTLRDLSRIVRQKGPDNDLVELNRTFPPLAKAALDPQKRNGERRRGALPEITKALNDGAKPASKMRPYYVDLVGWFDDFSHSGGYDAFGPFSRAQQYTNFFNDLPTDGLRGLIDLNAQIDALETQLGLAPGGELPGPLGGATPTEAEQQLNMIRGNLAEAREARRDLLDDVVTPIDDRVDEFLTQSRQQQVKKCPGSAEEESQDGSNVLSEEDQSFLNCDEDARSVGNF